MDVGFHIRVVEWALLQSLCRPLEPSVDSSGPSVEPWVIRVLKIWAARLRDLGSRESKLGDCHWLLTALWLHHDHKTEPDVHPKYGPAVDHKTRYRRSTDLGHTNSHGQQLGKSTYPEPSRSCTYKTRCLPDSCVQRPLRCAAGRPTEPLLK